MFLLSLTVAYFEDNTNHTAELSVNFRSVTAIYNTKQFRLDCSMMLCEAVKLLITDILTGVFQLLLT